MNHYSLDGKSVLITGGTGSLGNKLVHILLMESLARRVIVYSRDELKQAIMREKWKDDPRLRLFIGDVRDKDRLRRALANVTHVIHAAALKQVDAGETSGFEVVKTNIVGSENVIDAAIDTPTMEKVIFTSSDKAGGSVVNLYGATKLTAEKLFLQAHAYVGSGQTRFGAVRYGNVLGSRGSVLQVWRRCRENHLPLPVTDMRMTRFWLTIDQAARFVLSSLDMMQGLGDLYVPKIPSMKLTDLLSAFGEDELGHKVIGLRPGERLHETLISEDESRRVTELPDRFVIGLSDVNKMPFVYASNTNDQWLSPEAMRDLIKDVT